MNAGSDRSLLAEYDSFGPWIDVVRNQAQIPRLYRDHAVDFATALLVLKVPRNINRRDALPSMDLYDRMLIVDQTAMTVLSREGAVYTVSVVPHTMIAAITDRVDLLDGRLTVHTVDGGSIVVPYNGSSEDVIATLVDLLRSLSRPGDAARPRTTAVLAPLPPEQPAASRKPLRLDEFGRQDVAFVTTFVDLVRREPDMRLMAAHGRTTLEPRGGILSRALHAVFPMVLHGILLCRSATELQIISRKQWLVRGGAPELSRARTIIPLARIEAITRSAHPRYEGVDVIVLHVGGADIEVVVPKESAAWHALVDGEPAPPTGEVEPPLTIHGGPQGSTAARTGKPL
jgi:hypothetical protein